MLHLNLRDVLIYTFSSLNHDTVHARDDPQVHRHPLAGD
jgi:hypothetical protein